MLRARFSRRWVILCTSVIMRNSGGMDMAFHVSSGRFAVLNNCRCLLHYPDEDPNRLSRGHLVESAALGIRTQDHSKHCTREVSLLFFRPLPRTLTLTLTYREIATFVSDSVSNWRIIPVPRISLVVSTSSLLLSRPLFPIFCGWYVYSQACLSCREPCP